MRSTRIHAAPGIGIALAWHGAGFTGSGEVHLASVAGVELGDDGVIRVLIANTEIGQGTKTIFPMLAAEALGIDPGEVEMAPVDTSIVPDSGPTVASRTAMVVGGLVIQAAQRLRATVEAAQRRAVRGDATARTPGGTARPASTSSSSPIPTSTSTTTTYTGDAYPAFGWACAVAEVDVDLDTGEVHVRSVVSADDIGRVIHPILAEGQVEGGTLQAVGYATIEEMKLDDGRYLNDRLSTYLIPTSRGRAGHHRHPRREALQRRAARRQGRRRAAHGRRGTGHHRCHPRRGRRLDHAAAGDPGARARGPAGPAVAGPRDRGGRMTAVRESVGSDATYRFSVNGEACEVAVPGMRRLLDVLREELGLTGTKEGCGEGECGACSVIVDGLVVDSCLVPVCQVDGSEVRTVEGLSDAQTLALNPLQQAFLEAGGAQCGICTPGMLMAAQAYLDAGGGPDEEDIRTAIAGNLCRCTGYTKIIEAIELAALGGGRP